jgi:nucleoside phosphorylase
VALGCGFRAGFLSPLTLRGWLPLGLTASARKVGEWSQLRKVWSCSNWNALLRTAPADDDDDGEQVEPGRKRTRDEIETPTLFIYFAKNEEASLVNYEELGLQFVAKKVFEKVIPASIYKFKEISIGVIAGSQQGSGFYFDFVNFMSRVRLRAVIMCGICAGLGNCKVGDVAVGTHSVLMQGKIGTIHLTNIELEPCDSATIAASDNLWVGLGTEQVPVHVGTYLQSPFVLAFSLDTFKDRLQPAYRNIVAIDMESWFYLNSQKRLDQRTILPVVKGVSDKGAGKDDAAHKLAVNNSVRVALQILVRLDELDASAPLLTHGNSLKVSAVREKRSRTGKATTVTRDKAILALSQGIEDKAVLARDLEALDKVLHKEDWKKLGVRIFEDVKNFFSKNAQLILEELLRQ